jgi:hypothetical protein
MSLSKTIVALLFSCELASAQVGWKTYTHPTVGFRISYPPNLWLVPYREWAPQGDPNSPAQWRNTVFESKDGKVGLYVETHANPPGKNLRDFFNEEFTNRTQGGDKINYTLVKENWYVISGTNSKGFEFYKKFFVFPSIDNPDWWITFDFVYPVSQRTMYDPMATKIAGEFVPNLPGKYDH